MPLQPHQLGRFHFRRHGAADEIEHPVSGRGAFLRFGDGTVVELGTLGANADYSAAIRAAGFSSTLMASGRAETSRASFQSVKA